MTTSVARNVLWRQVRLKPENKADKCISCEECSPNARKKKSAVPEEINGKGASSFWRQKVNS
jgi:hypothetical protein